MISLVCKCSLPVSHDVTLHDLVEKTSRQVLLDVLPEEGSTISTHPIKPLWLKGWNQARENIIGAAKTKYGIELE